MKMNVQLKDRITMDSDICFGKPCIRGMRYPVELILDLLASGMTQNEILSDYPSLEEKDISACLLFAAEYIKIGSISKVLAH
jgi:uncharacterized protein (DUF433 family)